MRGLAVVLLAATACASSPPEPPPVGLPSPSEALYASCADAREAGAAPLTQGDAGYEIGLDEDHDGLACEE